MIKRIKQLFGGKKKRHKPVSFFDMPSADRKKIMKKVLRGANEDQRKIICEYENKYREGTL